MIHHLLGYSIDVFAGFLIGALTALVLRLI